MRETINVVSIGGGNGQSQVAQALIKSWMTWLRVAFITSAFDDDTDAVRTSTGRLRAKGNPGYYGDLGLVMGAICSACAIRDWLPEKLSMRFESGIAEGQTFGDLFSEAFRGNFREGMQGQYRHKAIKTISQIMGFDDIEDATIRSILIELLEFPLEADDFRRHSGRNLLLFALEQIVRRRGLKISMALEAMHVFYGIPDSYRVIPVSWESGTLKATTKSGKLITGQSLIDYRDRDPSFDGIDRIDTKTITIEPSILPAREAVRAIRKADVIIITCGSPMSNVFAPFMMGNKKLKRELRKRVKEASVPIVYIMNLVTEVGITRFKDKVYKATDVVELVREAIGCYPDYVICDTTPISREVREQLLPERRIEIGDFGGRSTLIRAKISMIVRSEDPRIPPKLIHDPEKLGRVFAESEIFSKTLVGAHS